MRENAGGFNQNTSYNARRGPREKVSETITPLFIKWLKDACSVREADVVRLDDFIIDKVVIYGRVIQLTSDSTKTYLIVEDRTDSAKLVSNKKHDEKHSRIMKDITLDSVEPTYVKAIIDISFYQNEILFTAIKVSPVTNSNYITYHILNCLQAQKVRVKGFPNHPADGKLPASTARKSEGFSASVIPKEISNSYAGSNSIQRSPEVIVKEVLSRIRQRTNRAVSIDLIVAELEGQLSRLIITKALGILQNASEVRKLPGQEIYDLY